MRIIYLTLLVFVVLSFGCNQKEEKSKTTETPVKKDTLPTTTQAGNSNYIPDISPMDMIYFPADYTKLKMAESISTLPVMRVIYSRPHLQGRKLFYNLQQYGQYWRLGANEATEIQFYRDVSIGDKKINSGRYVLYCIPKKDSWTIFLNTNIDTWGLTQDSTKNLQQFEIPVTHNNPHAEYFTMLFEKTETGADLVMAWDDVIARLPVHF